MPIVNTQNGQFHVAAHAEHPGTVLVNYYGPEEKWCSLDLTQADALALSAALHVAVYQARALEDFAQYAEACTPEAEACTPEMAQPTVTATPASVQVRFPGLLGTFVLPRPPKAEPSVDAAGRLLARCPQCQAEHVLPRETSKE